MSTQYDNMSKNDIIEFCQHSGNKTPLELILFLQQFKLLHKYRICLCKTRMVLVARNDVKDRWRWRCPKTTCRKTLTVRKNTVFEMFEKPF